MKLRLHISIYSPLVKRDDTAVDYGSTGVAVCRQNTIGSVEGELRNHEIREIQVDALLKLDRAAKNI
jgi:hypothetical protein